MRYLNLEQLLASLLHVRLVRYALALQATLRLLLHSLGLVARGSFLKYPQALTQLVRTNDRSKALDGDTYL